MLKSGACSEFDADVEDEACGCFEGDIVELRYAGRVVRERGDGAMAPGAWVDEIGLQLRLHAGETKCSMVDQVQQDAMGWTWSIGGHLSAGLTHFPGSSPVTCRN